MSKKPNEPVKDDPALQGEGNYAAARRYRESAEEFAANPGKVDEAAHAAKPDNPQQARELKEAEKEGKKHARK